MIRKNKSKKSLERGRGGDPTWTRVCIFAEGSMTRTGNLLKFRRGLERIAARA